jgi:hypothetical protein
VLNVFAPVIDTLDADVLLNVTLLNVLPPPLKVGTVLVQVMVEVPALNVRFVEVVKTIGVVFASDTLDPFNTIERTFELDEDSCEAVIE